MDGAIYFMVESPLRARRKCHLSADLFSKTRNSSNIEQFYSNLPTICMSCQEPGPITPGKRILIPIDGEYFFRPTDTCARARESPSRAGIVNSPGSIKNPKNVLNHQFARPGSTPEKAIQTARRFSRGSRRRLPVSRSNVFILPINRLRRLGSLPIRRPHKGRALHGRVGG